MRHLRSSDFFVSFSTRCLVLAVSSDSADSRAHKAPGAGVRRGDGERERERERSKARRGEGERERERERRDGCVEAVEISSKVLMNVSVARFKSAWPIASSKTEEIKGKESESSLATLGPRSENANSAAWRNLSAVREQRVISMELCAVWITSFANWAKDMPLRPLRPSRPLKSLIGVVIVAA